MLVALAALFVLLNALLWAVQAAREAKRQWRPTNTESGYRFPALADITSMEVRGWIAEQGTTEEATDFDAPEESWEEIMAALSPSAIDPLQPSCSDMGELRIRTKQGEEVCVQLWSFEGWATGGFSAGPSFETARFYRGGNTAALQKALEKAYSQHLRRQHEALQ